MMFKALDRSILTFVMLCLSVVSDIDCLANDTEIAFAFDA